ncbi:PH domain-containing protein [Streptomyces sp. NBC_00728]|uniref:PH domain-containing protein n=1 Tax=Streptomyces sp. NBC_00728 TaxID=2903676 RepID=UPI00386EB3DC
MASIVMAFMNHRWPDKIGFWTAILSGMTLLAAWLVLRDGAEMMPAGASLASCSLIYLIIVRREITPRVSIEPGRLVIRNAYLEHEIPWHQVIAVRWRPSRVVLLRDGSAVPLGAFSEWPARRRRRLVTSEINARANQEPAVGSSTDETVRTRVHSLALDAVCLVCFGIGFTLVKLSG